MNFRVIAFGVLAFAAFMVVSFYSGWFMHGDP